MSIEITLYPKNASKSSLQTFLLGEGFLRSNQYIKQFNTKNNIHFHWFESLDFFSFDGVGATLKLIDEKIQMKYSCCNWVLHTRTRSTASREDKEKQNDVIRKARKYFGGSFYNDWYGINKYTNLDDYKKFQPTEKGILFIYNGVKDKLRSIQLLLEKENEIEKEFKENIPKNKTLKKLFLMKDPNIVLYNSLIPFLVSTIEYFLSNSFQVLIKYNKKAQEILMEENIKVSFDEVIKAVNQDISLTKIIADNYNFQNLENSNKAFKKYLNIDLIKGLNSELKIKRRKINLYLEINRIIQNRHLIIHEYYFNDNYNKKYFFMDVEFIKLFLEFLIVKFEKHSNIKIKGQIL